MGEIVLNYKDVLGTKMFEDLTVGHVRLAKTVCSQPSISNCLYFLLFFTLTTFMHQMEQNGPLLGG